VTTHWQAARTAVGRPDVRLHDLRHSFASWLVKGGASMPTVRDLLGHSSLAVTSRYAHLSRPDLKRAVRKLKV
jgi:site-specific recombinase XerD